MFQKFSKKSRSKATNHLYSEYVHKDILIKIFSDVIQGKTTKLDADVIGCSNVADKWNEMIDTLCMSRRETILDKNNVLQMVKEWIQ